jgi:uncharacterized protein (AIM24 family)
MPRHSLADFVRATGQRDLGQGFFELENDRMLEVNLRNQVWMKTGAMIGYTGSVKFTREGVLEHGLGRFLKRAVSGKGTALTKAEGTGRLYLADSAKKVTILNLADQAIFLNGNDVLAFEPTLAWDVRMLRSAAGIFLGGLFNMRFEGTGMLALTTHFDPLTLEVRPGHPVFTDPNATVAWSASLEPQLHKDMSLKTFLGRGSGESIQMRFEGSGFVVIQPHEESYLDHTQSGG